LLSGRLENRGGLFLVPGPRPGNRANTRSASACSLIWRARAPGGFWRSSGANVAANRQFGHRLLKSSQLVEQGAEILPGFRILRRPAGPPRAWPSRRPVCRQPHTGTVRVFTCASTCSGACAITSRNSGMASAQRCISLCADASSYITSVAFGRNSSARR
jgi:hypothetical protein